MAQTPPPSPKPGKPVISTFPTPDLRDRIKLVLLDSRLPENAEPPEKGSKFTGPEAEKMEGWVFATRRPIDAVGMVNDFYVNERLNQEAYNYEVTYPYGDPNYPRVTRMFVFLREDYDDLPEPNLSETDPVFTDLKLVGYEQVRFFIQRDLTASADVIDPILDSLFIGLQKIYEVRPMTSVDSVMTSEFGGGILDKTQVTAVGGQTANGGYLVTDSKSEIKGLNTQVKETSELADASEWPDLVGDETDPHTGIIIQINKKVVPAGTRAPWPRVGHEYVDERTIDKWKTLQITSKVNPSSLPDPIVWNGFHEVDLPNTLLSVSANWDDFGGSGARAEVKAVDNGSSTVTVNAGGSLSVTSLKAGGVALTEASTEDGVDGNFILQVRHGYRGPAYAEFTELYTLGPPDPLDLPSPTIFQPVTGTASIIAKHASFETSKGTAFASLKNSGRLATKTLVFGPFLSAAITSTAVHTSTGASASAGSTNDLNGDTFASSLTQPGATGTLYVNIPASTPTSLTPGDWIYVVVQPERWRFDVWVTTIIAIQIPTP